MAPAARPASARCAWSAASRPIPASMPQRISPASAPRGPRSMRWCAATRRPASRRIVALRGDPAEGIGTAVHAASRRLPQRRRPRRRPPQASAISTFRSPPTRKSTRRARTGTAEIDNLKRKLDAGATRAITQMFFDNDDYFRLVDRAQAAGITAPIVPGIQPIHSLQADLRLCGALRRLDPGLAGRALRRARRGPRDPCAGCIGGRRRAGVGTGR